MDKADQGNVFDLLTKRNMETMHNPSEQFDYFAIGTMEIDAQPKGNEEFIIIQREPGRGTEMIRYVDILSVVCPVHQLLSVHCEQGIFQFEGQYLDVIPYHIQSRKLQLLQLYIPEWHHEPKDDEPTIRSITRDPEFITDEELAAVKQTEKVEP